MKPPFASCHVLTSCIVALALAASVSALEVPYDYHVKMTPETTIFGCFSATKKPVLTIKSGATVKIDGGGAAEWGRTGGEAEANAWLKANNIPATTETCPAIKEIITALRDTPRMPGVPGGHFIVGPIYVEGAEPGDSLEIRILDVTPRIPYGAHGVRPGGSALPDLVPRPFNHVYQIDLKRNVAIFDKDIEVPLRPFNGVNATCPPDSEGPYRSSVPPGAFGGNLDWKDATTGTTLYLPIFQKGALFYTGDCHAAQGDGEVAGNAIGDANTVIYQFILHKGVTLKGPRAETPTHYICFGLDTDLDVAMRNALIEMTEFMKEKKGMDFVHAMTLASACFDLHVTEVVDKVLGVYTMIPKKIFVNEPDSYWYRSR
jgi:acetamidase/formamidase